MIAKISAAVIAAGLLLTLTMFSHNKAKADTGSWGVPLPYPTSTGGFLVTKTFLVPTNNAGTLGTTNLALSTNWTSTVNLRPGSGMAIMPIQLGTSGSFGSNVTYTLDVTMDGVNFSSVSPSTLGCNIPCNGSTAVTGAYYFASSVLDGYKAARLGVVSTAATNAGGIIVSNVAYRIVGPQ